MKIIDKINQATDEGRYFYSFEYFPPKTDAGVENLYDRLDRMCQLNPTFIDVTWGAGGSTSNLTIDIATTAQNLVGLETMIHMTCTNVVEEDIKKHIQRARDNGIQNILALRGDPPRGVDNWQKVEGGYAHAVDLVRLIRREHGDYFGIGVAGYPEGHPDSNDYQHDLECLKVKVDAGADFIITQLFYDTNKFLKFVKDCREIGINCPIIPGIMPIQNYAGWKRMITFCKTYVPQEIIEAMEPIKDNDEEVKAYGIKLGITMCRHLLNNGIRGLHFYTLNLEKSVVEILTGLQLVPESIHRSLPWKLSANAKRCKEDVRPIFWANRPKSYLARTQSWDEFPNGRWGDSRSPAFGDLNDYHLSSLVLGYKNLEEKKKIWGRELTKFEDVCSVFTNYMEGKLDGIPWYDKRLEPETVSISKPLAELNRRGFLTINSQPRVNGIKSDDKVHGWGGKGGYVYQKAYIEFFTSPAKTRALINALNEKYPDISYHAVNMKGDSFTNTGNNVNAVTWGVFPGKEIVQPTIVDPDSFLVWKSEAFSLWIKLWGDLYDNDTLSKRIIQQIHDTFYLVNIVDNDFISGNIFRVFEENNYFADADDGFGEDGSTIVNTTN